VSGMEDRFAMHCGIDGSLQSVIRDDSGLLRDIEPGRMFPSFVDKLCMGEALDFLLEIRKNGASFDHEFSIPSADGVALVHCIGAKLGEHLLIAGSGRREGILELYEDLIRMSNEQGTHIRELEKKLSRYANLPVDSTRQHTDDLLFSDVTRLNNELVSAQRELARKNTELSRTDEIKNRFLGMASHDLRAPLAVVVAYSDTMLDSTEPALAPAFTAYVQRIRSSAMFMSELVDDLLDTAAIESGRLKLDPYPHDMVELVHSCVETGRLQANKRGVKISVAVPEQKLVAVVDDVRIAQALNNLISNAVKFSRSGATVAISLASSGEDVVLRVEDHGSGIPADMLEKIFSPFGTPTIRGPSGEKCTGLGLLISRRVAEAHRGTLDLTSESGRGTIATITIPRTAMME